jgi:uncharacterized protein
MRRTLGAGGPAAVARATALGAASSSCSYAAVAIARSLFAKGASAASALAFQLASTNLVWELGLVLWVLIGWQFTVAEYLGGVVMIVLMAAGLRLFVSREGEEAARAHAVEADPGHQHHAAASEHSSWLARLTSAEAWSDVAHNFRGDWKMLWREVAIGFLLAGFVAQLVGRDRILRGAGLPVRRPDRAADHRHLPQVLRARVRGADHGPDARDDDRGCADRGRAV